MPCPRGNVSPALDGRWREHRPWGWPGGGGAELPHERAPGAEGLKPGHLLFDDRRDQGVEHEVGAGEPQAGIAVVRVGDEGVVVCFELFWVVMRPEQCRDLRDRPFGAGPPS